MSDLSAVNKNEVVRMIVQVKPEAGQTSIEPAEDLWLNGKLDSFAVVHLVTLFEESFGFVFDFNDMRVENFRSVDSIFKMLTGKYRVKST
jgi:acyl carrier protein